MYIHKKLFRLVHAKIRSFYTIIKQNQKLAKTIDLYFFQKYLENKSFFFKDEKTCPKAPLKSMKFFD